MEREQNDWQAEVGQPHCGGDSGSEEGVAHRLQHEGRAVRVERGVEQALDSCHVEAAVLGAGMVAIDGDGEEGQRADQKQGEAAFAPLPAASSLRAALSLPPGNLRFDLCQ